LFTVSKKVVYNLMAITLSIVNRHSKFFHCWKEKQISNKIYIILPNILSVCCRTTLRKLIVQVLAYLEENAKENANENVLTCINF